MEVLSTEVMSHIKENKDDFYSSFQSVSKLENESENLIECCARYFQGAAYNTDSVDICIAAIVKTLSVNIEEEEEAEKALKKKQIKVKVKLLQHRQQMSSL